MAKIALHTLWCLRTDFIGGTERFLVELSKELVALGHEPFIVCSNLQPEQRIEGISVIGRVPDPLKPLYVECGDNIAEFVRRGLFNKPAGEATFRQISEYVEQQFVGVEADIAHLNAFSASLYADLGCPKVVTNHENELELDNFWHAGAFEVMANLIRDESIRFSKNTYLCAPSEHYAEEYSRRLGIKVNAIPLGVCLNNFMANQDSNDQYPQKRVLMPSRFFPKQKGQDLALDACRILRAASEINFYFVFTGIRDYYTHYVSGFLDQARDLGVSDRVKIKKYAQIQDAYRQADIVISPERYCSYGLSISEALSLGIPTVLTSIPTYLEIAGGYEHAVFFDVDDADGLATAILKAAALDRNKLKRSMVKFRTNNDFRDCAKKYSDAYLSLLCV